MYGGLDTSATQDDLAGNLLIVIKVGDNIPDSGKGRINCWESPLVLHYVSSLATCTSSALWRGQQIAGISPTATLAGSYFIEATPENFASHISRKSWNVMSVTNKRDG